MSDSGSGLQVRSKIRLEIDGDPVFGQGREELLRQVQKGNSINAAAKAMLGFGMTVGWKPFGIPC
jgi:molybdate transport system regulatory protein